MIIDISIHFVVVEPPPPPMDLTISANVFTSTLNITWKSENQTRETYYVVHVIDNSTSTQMEQIDTTETHVQYDLRELIFNSSTSIDCHSLPSVVFSVSAVHSWSDEVSCTSEESKVKRIPDINYIIQKCTHSGIHKFISVL